MKKIFWIIIFLNVNFTLFSDNMDNMKTKLDRIEKNIQENKKNVTIIKQKEEAEKNSLNKIQKDLNTTKEKYYQAEAKHEALSKKVEYAQKNLTLAEDELKGKKGELQMELRQWYKFGEKREIEYIFSGQTLYEIMDRFENVSKIVNKSKKDIQNVKTIKEKIEKEKSGLEIKKSEMLQSKIALEGQKQLLNRKAVEKNSLIGTLKNKEKYLVNELDRLKAEKKKTEQEIQKIIEERVKRAKKEMGYTQIREKVGKMLPPIQGDLIVGYGEDKEMDFGAKIKSSGIEIRGKMGDRIKAASNGEIIFVGNISSLGTVIIIDNGNGVATVYGNILRASGTVGKKVSRGDIIGILGLSETEREPILYFEVRVNSRNVDPMGFLK